MERRPCVATAYRRWLERFRGQTDASTGEDLYVSRGALGSDMGQFLEESVLEADLGRNGYAIFHPETVPIGEQIRRDRRGARHAFGLGRPARRRLPRRPPAGRHAARSAGWLSPSGARTGRIPRPDLPLDPRSLDLIAARRRFTLRETV
ncbi:MAG: hypothetical protein ACK40I_00540 [Tabrizicola sp.]